MKRVLSVIILLALLCSMAPCVAINANAATYLPDSIYLAQQTNYTCTLTAATMMLRSRMYLSYNDSWNVITESSVRPVGWLEGSGLYFNFTYRCNSDSMTVSHSFTSGISVEDLKALLDSHKEGVVLYCGNSPHAVFLTDYEGNTFYCADPAGSYSGRRIPLTSSLLGARYGSQANILTNVTAYWYISNYSITPSDNIPVGVVDVISTEDRTVHVRGWAYDRDDLNRSVKIRVYVGSTFVGEGVADQHRPDVNENQWHIGVGEYHGYDFTCQIPFGLSGTQTVSVYAIDEENVENKLLGKRR